MRLTMALAAAALCLEWLRRVRRQNGSVPTF